MDTASSHTNGEETVRWSAYPSWAHFVWLYLFSAMAGVRGLIALRWGVSGWEAWIVGAAALLLCAAVLRHWAQYRLTTRRAIVSNGYTGRDIQTLDLEEIADVSVQQGPVARFWDIGTLIIRSAKDDRVLSLRGVRDPEIMKTRLDALRPK